jgi:hypothetical protein
VPIFITDVADGEGGIGIAVYAIYIAGDIQIDDVPVL